MNYTRRTTNRKKSIGLVVKPDGSLEVRAPKWVSETQILNFLEKQQDWIEKRLQEISEQPKAEPLKEGSFIYLFGERFKLQLHIGSGNSIIKEGKCCLYVANNSEVEIKQALIAFYKEQAKKTLPPLLEHWAHVMNEPHTKLTITSAKTRWGSCKASERHIRLSYRLMLVPEEAQEYIVIHELAHLKHMDHSSNFWARVAEFYPEYKTQEAELKQWGTLTQSL